MSTSRRPLTRRLLRLAGAAGALWLAGWFVLPFAVPLPPALRTDPPASPVLLDRHGAPLHHLTLPDFTRSRPVALDELPAEFIDATLAAEDRRFFSHPGIDLLATARAAADWLRHGRPRSGASTITQQLVKLASDPAPRTLPTKLRECLLARRLEMTRPKQWILTNYLNRLEYGSLRRGPAEAARFFLDKPPRDLSLAECALLAGLPQAPSRLNPLRHPERAAARRATVLARLERNFHYAPERLARARAEPVRLRHPARPAHAPWLGTTGVPPVLANGRPARCVGEESTGGTPVVRLRRDDGAPAADAGAFIHTTLDLPLQRDVEAIVRTELAALAGTNARHAAVVVLDNPTGQLLALVNSGDWHDPLGGQLNGALVPRSPGSALKPFTYLLAVGRGGAFPGSVLADVPTRFRTAEGLDAPDNYDHVHRGPVTIRQALASSLNVAAMRQLNQLGGPRPLHDLLVRLGLTTLGPDPEPHGLGLTLGNAPVRLLELANAYATLARGGRHLPCTLRLPLPTDADSPLAGATSPTVPDSPSLFSPESAFLIADILADPAARASAFGPADSIRLPFRCAVKTGTSSDFHDNWCLGFTPELTVGVWVGNFEFNPMKGISGISGAGPIFRRTILRAHRDRPATWFQPPTTLARITIDPRTGKRLDPACPATIPRRQEWCQTDRFPLAATPADYDQRGRARLDPRFREWLDSAPLADHARFTLDPAQPVPEPLRILAPRHGATYLLDPELPSGGRRLRLATSQPGLASWSSDTLGFDPTTPEPTALLTPGTHTLTATDPRTRHRQQVVITVESL